MKIRRTVFYHGLELLLVATVITLSVILFRGPGLAQTVLLVVALGLISVPLVTVFHDCLHGSAYRSPWLNRTVGWLLGSFYLAPFTFIRHTHLSHHSNIGRIEGDSEIFHLSREVADQKVGGHLLAWIASSPLGSVFYAPTYQMIDFAFFLRSFRSLPREKRIGFGFDLLGMTICWSVIYCLTSGVAHFLKFATLSLLVPYAIGLSIIFFVGRPLHTFTLVERIAHLPFPSRVLLATRSFETNRWFKMYMGNLNYHVEHHLAPNLSRWELGRQALRIRRRFERYGRERDIPYLIHPGYRGWYKATGGWPDRYNPCTSVERLCAENARFEFVRWHEASL